MLIAAVIAATVNQAIARDRTNDAPSLPAAATIAQARRSAWDGIYSAEQAARGQQTFIRTCSYCHGDELDGADDPNGPPLRGSLFLRRWDNATVGELFGFVRENMPENDPGRLTAQAYVDIVSFILKANGAPPGDTELPPDPAKLNEIALARDPSKR